MFIRKIAGEVMPANEKVAAAQREFFSFTQTRWPDKILL
jgi:hypothetical protein